MFGLSKLTSAVATLTGNVLALAGTVAEVNQGVRARLQLDLADEPLVLDHKPDAEAEAPSRSGRKSKATAG